MAKISARDVQAACEEVAGKEVVYSLIRAGLNLPRIMDYVVLEVFYGFNKEEGSLASMRVIQRAGVLLRSGYFFDGVARIPNE